MLTGFEKETESLTKDEVKWAMIIGRTLKGKIGKEKAVKSQDIIKGMRDTFNAKISDPRLRKIINFLRTKKLVKWLISALTEEYGLEHIRNLGKKSITEIKRALLAESYMRLTDTQKDSFWQYVLERNAA